MFLIIPTIPILHGHCESSIKGSLKHRYGQDATYSLDPVERARLLRKENAKTIHVEFHDCDPWDSHSIDLVRELREAIDVPIEISLLRLPASPETLLPVFGAGANRFFLPVEATLEACYELSKAFPRKIVPTYLPDLLTQGHFEALKEHKIDRIALELNPPDLLEPDPIDWQLLTHLAATAASFGVHITALHGIAGYPDLARLQSLAPSFDSLVLCRALNENRFPCQMLWRELEEEFAIEIAKESNLWSNPLEGKPHI